MNRDQLAVHIALLGWEAWYEPEASPPRFNLTHPSNGTVWAWAYSGEELGYSPAYMHLSPDKTRIDCVDIPDLQFFALWKWLQEHGYGV